MTNRKEKIEKLVLGAILTALVVTLQLLGSFIRFGPFAISLVLVPIVIGSAMCGYKIGAWLGFVFGVVVLLSGDAAAFLAISVPGTIATVLVKGTLCGLCAGLTYNAITECSFSAQKNTTANKGAKNNKYLAVIIAAIVCPLVNTGVFLLGCKLFFMSAINAWGAALGFKNAAHYMFIGLAGGNFLFELITNIILAPVILKILNFKNK